MPLADMGRYATVVIDPPWPVRVNHSKYPCGLPYPVMTDREIRALPVGAVLAEDAFIFLWATQKRLPTAVDLLGHWGCRYRFTMAWHKEHGPQVLGHPRFNLEFVVVGSKGKPKFETTKAFSTAYCWPRRKHSEKPHEFYELLQRVTPAPRLDIFARRHIDGFDAWGNEAPRLL